MYSGVQRVETSLINEWKQVSCTNQLARVVEGVRKHGRIGVAAQCQAAIVCKAVLGERL